MIKKWWKEFKYKETFFF